MLEEKDQELHTDVGEEEKPEATEVTSTSEKTSGELKKRKPAAKSATKPAKEKAEKNTPAETEEKTPEVTSEQEVSEVAEEKAEEKPAPENKEDVHEEIDDSNAEDAEDEDNHRRHHIPMQDYHAMSMENLVGELQRLIRTEKVQAIKNHVDAIKSEFDLKFQEFIEEKKEEFVAHGGNEVDFRYNSVAKRQFNEVYADYREKRNSYYRNLEQSLKANLEKRLQIIEELKALVNMEEDINTTYKNFKSLQEQ
ncbi:DUF349 domain-containing protein, partial [Muriicola sp.]